MKKFLLCASLLGLLFTSCEKKESELNLEDIQEKAVIEGTLSYNQGKRLVNGVVVECQSPLSNATVVVSVPYSEYQENSQGEKKYEAVTDSEGKYSIEIPVGLRTMTVTVGAKSFKDTYYTYDILDGEKEVSALYEAVPASVEVKAGDIKWEDVIMKADQATNFDRTTKISVKGSIFKEAEVPYLAESQTTILRVNKGKEPAESASAIVEFSVNGSNESISYIVKTNSEGEYSLKAELFDKWDLSNVNVKVTNKPYLGKLKHYYKRTNIVTGDYKWITQDVDGLYDNVSKSSVLDLSSAKLVAKNLAEITIPFYITNSCEVRGIGNDIDMQENIDYSNPFDWDSCE
jgi:hypothetical protein